jgi:LCP family protein required for cell wall assembly
LWGTILDSGMTKKKTITIFLLVILFLASATIAYFWGVYKNIYVPSNKNISIAAGASVTPTPTPDPLGPRNILLLGYGGASHVDGSLLTDTMIVAHILPREKEVTLISIPRDIFVPLAVEEGKTKKFKVNHAYAIGTDDVNYPNKSKVYNGLAGGGLMAEEGVSMITGLNIQNWVSVDFIGFINIVDALGGVSVNVPYSFEDDYYPITGEEDNTCGKSEEEVDVLTATMSGDLLLKEFPCRFEKLVFSRGAQIMDGQTALEFVRSRHSAVGGSDFGRSQRQQAFLVAIKNKLLSYKSIPRLIPVINLLSKNTRTDIDIKTGIDLLKQQASLSDVEIKTISLTTDNVLKETYATDGQYILIPKSGDENWESIHKYIDRELSPEDTQN